MWNNIRFFFRLKKSKDIMQCKWNTLHCQIAKCKSMHYCILNLSCHGSKTYQFSNTFYELGDTVIFKY